MRLRVLTGLFLGLFTVALILPDTVNAQSGGAASEAGVRAVLEQRDREIKALLGNKQSLTPAENERLKSMVNSIIDFEAMGRTALGPHWNELTPEQRHEFVDVFGDIVRTQSLSNLDVYRTAVSYDRIHVNGNTALVTTSVTYRDVPTRVEYTMALRGGEWRVDDIAIDEVSTAEGYARSFQPVVKRRGFDSLMVSLRKKQSQSSASS